MLGWRLVGVEVFGVRGVEWVVKVVGWRGWSCMFDYRVTKRVRNK